ncbi:bifunctional adenosylcobinamide kinase/adenosylcobinamide-phosphate guanylyltransferase [Aestuariivirga litoralis]|uniref:Bifunctional adenosylcobalamin biosynthesis protein n=1 Tax=Aestuariivirga litoralis TaxID=2650924 RepID=A0A2W2AW03_9HYPH|nr:bifunctional adenosylcobinamide kinase/adenosylcobinamide-phosphate guanylyltransferase [Aestuariivirga litoralis]PZF76790.1 bifunctional adenosylcobinamide kinase/adenosylcobinamide-phosphate guanylyltransferase [Aestuariivirga litoralis]
MSRLTLVLGGARSGKSRFAESLARQHGGPRTYIATAEPFDDEMRQRIARHRDQRAGDGWQTLEAPLDPAAVLPREGLVLLDCVTVWLGNLMHHGRDLKAEVTKLCAALEACPAEVILVSNEVGLSIVPENAMARRFRDEQGLANQALAAIADNVFFIAAGLPLKLKG